MIHKYIPLNILLLLFNKVIEDKYNSICFVMEKYDMLYKECA